MICAVDEEFGFGKNGEIPWYYSEDLNYFKNITKDGILIMGKNSYLDALEYFENKPFMPGREVSVISSTINKRVIREGVTVFTDVDFSIRYYQNLYPDKQIYFCGGKEIFEHALDVVDRVYLAKIPGVHECDVFLNKEKLLRNFSIMFCESGKKSKELLFQTYRRKTCC